MILYQVAKSWDQECLRDPSWALYIRWYYYVLKFADDIKLFYPLEYKIYISVLFGLVHWVFCLSYCLLLCTFLDVSPVIDLFILLN